VASYNPYTKLCRLRRIPDNFFDKEQNLNLKHLYLTNSQIKVLGNQTFNGLAALEKLDLTSNKISDLPAGVFQPLEAVKTINLTRNRLKSINFERFSGNRNLQELQLDHNLIEGFQPIVHKIRPSITKIWLSDNKLVNIFGLCQLKGLTTLDLSNNPNLDYESFNFNCWYKLQHLNLKNTGLTNLNKYSRSFANLQKLNYLNFGRNNLTIFCVVNFPELPVLEYLDISENKLKRFNGTDIKLKFFNIQKLHMALNPWDCTFLNEFFELDIQISLGTELKCYNYTLPVNNSDACKRELTVSDTFFDTTFFKVYVICGLFVPIIMIALIIYLVHGCCRSHFGNSNTIYTIG
jgi:Leucine-rich repeat (LRR) protein